MSDTVLEAAPRTRQFSDRPPNKFVTYAMLAFGALIVSLMASVPLSEKQQTIVAVAGGVVFLVANRFPGRKVSLFLIMLSLTVSMRYIFWRVTQTLSFSSPLEAMLGAGLALAETYAVVVLLLGYFQTSWPLERTPIPLPEDSATWPTVDVFIPTYNESLSVVRATVLACMGMDWPPDKMRVHILDDGRRAEFREFAEEAGCNYIIRDNNAHAKAGNLNHAMGITSGEFVAIFDCDHVPTRAFLQMTMGWLIAEPNLAMVQTPHHFYSPDPFQRNLAAGTRVPAEGNLFYGLLQPGNDYWNACFFCGSCAVLRRSALEQVGGIAVETVTEDAHTMLKLHRLGWDSAFLRLPLAAGLATERLMLHIGQRMRWARGMIQILRIDNPLFGPGLKLGQRLCYFQAMSHFLFALPRIVFLTSPLAYLIGYQNVFAASPLAIVAYGMPHIVHAVATNSRLQKHWRHSFWSEIYETSLALYLVRLTFATLWNPYKGKFNVTAKGGLLDNGYFDLGAVYPNLILTFLLVLGLGRGLFSLLFQPADTLTFQALLLNEIWALLSLLIVLAALAVGRETRQVRVRHRVRAHLPVVVHLPDDRLLTGVTRDVSQGGCAIYVARPDDVMDNDEVHVEFSIAGETHIIPAKISLWRGNSLQLQFVPETIADEASIVRVVFGRADAWLEWADYSDDQPLASLWRVLVSIRGLFRPRNRPFAPPPGKRRSGGERTGPTAARIAALFAALMLLPQTAHAQPLPLTPSYQPQPVMQAQAQPQTVIRPLPQPTPSLNEPPLPTLPAPAAAPASPAQTGTQAGAQDDAAQTNAVLSVPPSQGLSQADAPPGSTRRVVFSLAQLGTKGPLQLRGTSELQGVQFGIRSDEVVTAAELDISGAMSPALIPEWSNDTVTLNEQYVGTIPVNRDQPRFNHMIMPINPVFFQDNNRLNFRFTGRYTRECNDPLSGLLWSTISDTSTLTLTLQRLPAQRDLGRLPLPFFDPKEKTRLVLPFVLPNRASSEVLQAAGTVASWFGQQTTYRGASFPVLEDWPTDQNGVLIFSGSPPADLGMADPVGPTLAVVPNPKDPMLSLLVIAGRNGAELQAAAATLVVGNRGISGASAVVPPPSVAPRKPYDAPFWIPTDRPVRLGELADATSLQTSGYVGTIRVPFRTAPDFYTWNDRFFPLTLRYHAPPGPIVDLAPSRVDVGINGIYLQSFSLAGTQLSDGWWRHFLEYFGLHRPKETVYVPPYDVFGQDDLQFFFDTRPLHRGDCVAVPNDLIMGIDPESKIDFRRAYRFTEMPNLAYFVSSGFPFTRMADFSETAVVLPSLPTSVETGAFLDLMGRFGSITGYPTLRARVVRPEDITSLDNQDLLVMGTLSRLGQATDLLRNSPVRPDNGSLSLNLSDSFTSTIFRIFGDNTQNDRDRAAATISGRLGTDMAAIVGAESPLHAHRSVVAFLASSPQALDHLVESLGNPTIVPQIQGDLTLLSGNSAASYRVGATYTVGSLPFWIWPSWLMRDHPISIAVFMTIGCAISGFALFRLLRGRASRRVQHQSRSH